MAQDRVALYLQDAHDLREGMKLVQYAEKHNFEAVWQAESRLVRDAIVPMAAFAAVTERIKVGSGCNQQLDPQHRVCWRPHFSRSMTWLRIALFAGSARGGTRWLKMWASPAASRCWLCAKPSR